jgi:transcriptional regulator with XRE-family HTH domain
MIMSDKFVIAVGKKIRELRKLKGFSQEGFAHEVGISRSFYYSLENGKKSATISTLIRIAITLNVEVGQLFPPVSELKNIK